MKFAHISTDIVSYLLCTVPRDIALIVVYSWEYAGTD